MNISGYDNLPDESPPEHKHKRKDSTRELNGSYILACRGEESLETSGFDPMSPVSSKGNPKVYKDLTVYSSIALDDSDYTNDTTEVKPKRSRIIHDSIADKSLPNPHNTVYKDLTVYSSIALDDSDYTNDTTEVKPKRSRIIHDSIADKSLPNPHNTTDAPHCRICHEGDEEEDLLSPCFCSGSVGALHMSCLEKWLGASDKTRCEICGFQFSISKNPKPVTWFLKNKSLGRERRYLIADIGCAIWFTPFTIGSFTGCMIGASYFTSVDKDWQATTLILLAMINLLIFSLWCGFTIRRNYILCSTWRENFQEIKIKYNPPDKNDKQTVSRGNSVTDRMLLENSFKTVHAEKTSEFPAKSIIRKITYETSPKHRKQHCHIELEERIRRPCNQGRLIRSVNKVQK
ncbi:MARCH2 [Mytilus coruscus]|uniref:MARCH2 n=1 Tax=Mytilus coruscus TaxID=42192 RepID=A0A6J8DD14_MYTCO|nr:MARCH2 [Mytilus coruscus]